MNIGAVGHLSRNRVIAVFAVAVLALLFGLSAKAIRINSGRRPQRLIAARCLVTFITLGLAGDYVFVAHEARHLINPFHGTRPSDEDRFSNYETLWLGRYPILRLARNQKIFARRIDSKNTLPGDEVSIASASSLALKLAEITAGRPIQEMPDVVLVLVESWGVETDPDLRSSLVRYYDQSRVLDKYSVVQGTVPFYGATVGAEARELCGSKIGLRITTEPKSKLQHCLPDILGSWGYSSMALHGMDGGMFDRTTWYRTMGFEDQWFRERFSRDGLPTCSGAFIGICDTSIAEWIQYRLQQREGKPRFIHWVTLNSHLPVPRPSGGLAGAFCSLSPVLSREPALCSWYQLVSHVQESVVQVAMTDLGRPTVFVIVGDHAPPFGNAELRNQFSESSVPYVILVPHQTKGNAKS